MKQKHEIRSKHTPGPWKYQKRTIRADELQPEFRVTDILADVGIIEHCTIAMVLDADSFEPNDARLIAAAPELLEAAKMAAAYLDAPDHVGSLDKSGTPHPLEENTCTCGTHTAFRMLLTAIAKAERKE